MSVAYTLAELLRTAIQTGAARLHVALPATVLAYHAAEQTVDVQPSLTLDRLDETDQVLEEQVPTIFRCPVQFPGGGGFALTFPVQQGDPCLLVFTDRALDTWIGQTGQVVSPVDPRRHDLSDAIALLGVRTVNGALSAAPTDRTVLGTPGGFRLEVGPGAAMDLGGGSSDYVALASKVDAMRTIFNAHTHPTAPSGPVSAPSTSMSSAVGSSKVKVAT